MIDLVFPTGNEKEFIAMAEQLGISALCFIDSNADLAVLQQSTRVALVTAASNPNHHQGKAAFKICPSHDNARELIERGDVDAVYQLEDQPSRDKLHQRASGFNQVLAVLAADKGKLIGFSLRSLLIVGGSKRSQLLGRMQQNIALCRKYKTGIILASFATTPYEMRAPHDMIAVGQLIGMTAGEAAAAMVAVEKKVKEKT